MSELPAEEMLLNVAATITEEEIGSMISNDQLSQLIKAQPMTELRTNAIHECIILTPAGKEFKTMRALAREQLQALLDENADLARTVRALESCVTENELLHATLDTAKCDETEPQLRRITMKETYAVLIHAVIDENIPQRGTVIVTTDEGEDCEYYAVAECGVEDAWLVMGALQFQADIKYDRLLAECEEIAEQITQENLKAIKTELKNIK